MTFIITCLTREYIVQVSDRRLSAFNDRTQTYERRTDAANKALFLDSKYVFGFTGPAEIKRQRSDLWLADQLQRTEGLPLNSRFRAVIDALPAAVAPIPKKFRPLAFSGGGFARLNGGDVLPVGFQISNFMGKNGKPIGLQDRFSLHVLPIEAERDFRLLEAGASLLKGARDDVRRNLRSARKQGKGPAEIARILVEGVWRLARIESTVGSNLMVCILPKVAIEKNMAIGPSVSGGLKILPDQVSFFYVGQETAQLIQFGPTVVMPGMLATDLWMSFGNDEQPVSPPSSIAAIHYQGLDGTKTPADASCPCGSGQPYKGCHDKSIADATSMQHEAPNPA